MLALIIKLACLTLFAFFSYDSFRHIGRVKKDVEDGRFNPLLGKTLTRRAMINGFLYALISLAAFASLFTTIAPLGE